MSGKARRPIFTIGHSSLPIDEFVSILRVHGVETVVDVRSVPFSKRFTQYGRRALESSLSSAFVKYVYLGKELGARRVEREAYDGEIAAYERIAALPRFTEGMTQLQMEISRTSVALMCAEKDPLKCHRTILVCKQLPSELREEVVHILGQGRTESHREAEARLTKECGVNVGQEDLFLHAGESSALAEAYRRRGREIAWRRSS